MADNYNEQFMGTIDYIISYDENTIPTKDVLLLMKEVGKSLNKQYKVFNSERFNIHFSMEGIEDHRRHELNGLIKLAFDRQNDKVKLLDVLRSQLNPDEWSRFYLLSRQIEGKEPK